MEKYSAFPQFLCTACRRSRKKYLEASEMASQRAVRSERSFWKLIQEMQLKMLQLDKRPRKLQRLQVFLYKMQPSFGRRLVRYSVVRDLFKESMAMTSFPVC